MAEIVAFPNDIASFCEAESTGKARDDFFLLDEGLELLADFRSIPNEDVRTSLRALVKSMARSSARLSS